MTSFDKTNVIVSGSRSAMGEYANYTTVIPKPILFDGHMVLTQSMISKPNTKYVIKWNFDLNGTSITVPQGCLIEFDGGSFSNGTLVGNNTILMYKQPIEEVLDVTLSGTFIYDDGQIDKIDNANGMGKIYLKKDKSFASQITQPNTTYVIQYDFTLTNDVTIPANCVLEFDGGSISGNHKITANNTRLDGNIRILCDFTGKFTNSQLNIDWFGAISADHVTTTGIDNTVVLQRVLTCCALYGNTMYIPVGKYIFSDTISLNGITYDGDAPLRQMPSIKGESPLRDFAIAYSSFTPCSMLVYNGANNKPAIDLSYASGIDGGTLENFSIFRNETRPNDNTIGLKLNTCINFRIYNVSIQGFGIGLKNTYGWSWRAFGLTCTQNHIGIVLEDNSNAISLIGCQLHQNGFIGVWITGGINIEIDGCTLEGQPVGICASRINHSNTIKISSCYFEQNEIRDIILGASISNESTYTIEDSANTLDVVEIENCNTVSSIQPVPIYIGNVKNVNIHSYVYGGDTPLADISDKAENVNIDYSSFRNTRFSKSKNINFKSKNLIINGGNSNIFRTTWKTGTFETINGITYQKYIIPPGNGILTTIKLSPEEFLDGIIYYLSGTGFTTGGTVSLTLYKPSYDAVVGIQAGIFEETKKTLTGRFESSDIKANEYVNLSLYRSNPTGEDQYFYIESVSFAPAYCQEFTDSDDINCVSGSVNADSNGVEVSIPYYSGEYNVIATNTGNADAQIRVVKGDKKITIYSTVSTQVDFSIVRL